MDDLYLILLVIFFVVVPLLEKILKGGTGADQRRRSRLPQQQRRPLPDRTEQPPREPRRIESVERERAMRPPARSEEEIAAEMIPAELWEILTGQRRPTTVPAPSPEADVDEELAGDEEAEPARARTTETTDWDVLRREREEETARRRVADREPPKIISLETEVLPEPARHAAFHQQLTAAPVAPTLPAPATAIRPRRHALATLLRNDEDLRRGIILQEVLGRPKGLE